MHLGVCTNPVVGVVSCGKQGAAFWPVYRQYQLELDKITDERIALIKDYAEHFEMMTDEKARELADWSFGLQEERLQLRKRFYGEFEAAVGRFCVS